MRALRHRRDTRGRRSPAASLIALILLIALPVASLGCGYNEEEDETVADPKASAGATVTKFFGLAAQGDSDNACSQLTPEEQARLAEEYGIGPDPTCEAAIEGPVQALAAKLGKPGETPTDPVKLDGETATVTFSDGPGAVTLELQSGSPDGYVWLISDIGRF